MKYFALLFSLLMLLSVSHSLECIENATSFVLTEQGTLIALVLLVTMFIIIFAYIAGIVTNNPSFTVFAKDEAWHFAFSLVLLMLFSVILLLACNSVDFFYKTTLEEIGTASTCYDSSAEMTEVSICFLDLAKRDAEVIAENSIDKYIDKLMGSTWSVTISIPLLNSVTSAAGAFRRIDAFQYDTVLYTFVFPSLISFNMQQLFLEFVSDVVLKWILPSAFVLRIFPPTRQIGNMLIALAVGLYVIVPFMYTFNLAMYDVINDDYCMEFHDVVYDSTFGGCGDTGNFWDIARLLPQAFFLPNLTIAFLITFLVGVNKALRVIG